MQPITEARVREVLQNTPLLEPADFAHLTEQANADAGEGLDWLPYYKIALGVLMHAFGRLHAAADQHTTPGTVAHRRRLAVIAEAELLARLSCRPCGIGPVAGDSHADRVDEVLDRDWPVPTHVTGGEG